MGLPESKNRVGLGRALMKSKNINPRGGGGSGGKGKGQNQEGPRVHYAADTRKEFSSITEQAALDEFLATAELADTDFTAEKMNIKVIHRDQKNPYLLSAEEEKSQLRKQKAHSSHLTVPRRPPWDASTTPAELDRLEKESFLLWRRGLAELQENKDLLMTPFERNLEMWRQLWRVIERSDLVVQIVDARNPLLFRSDDLERYVKEVDPRKNNLLLINKADMMTINQRREWAAYFERENMKYTFFSAAMAAQAEVNDEEEGSTNRDREEGDEGVPSKELGNMLLNEDDIGEVISDDDDDEIGVMLEGKGGTDEKRNKEKAHEEDAEEEGGGGEEEEEDPRTRILTADELEELFLAHAPPPVQSDDSDQSRKTIIGLVGYPNVGKSSTINALIRAKKVSVSSTPGKTKHFQTIHLSPSVILCDCPGLVFPNFATTKAELVCNGILPIDQLREFTGPVALVARRIPQPFLEAVYGIKISVRPPEEGGTGLPTAEELLRAYAKARGFTKTGVGEPDESRAARYILKDYVNGKLLFCQPPAASPPIDVHEFNRDLYDEAHLPFHRQTGVYLQEGPELMSDLASVDLDISGAPMEYGAKSMALDRQFFSSKGARGDAGHMTTPFRRPMMTNGKQLSGRKAKAVFAAENGLTMEEVTRMFGKKKHFKGKKGGLM